MSTEFTKRRTALRAMAGPLLLLASGAGAANATVDSTRCYLVANAFAKLGTEKERPLARDTSFFYAGKLDASSSKLLESFLMELKTIARSNSGEIMNECVRAMRARLNEVAVAQQGLAKTKDPSK